MILPGSRGIPPVNTPITQIDRFCMSRRTAVTSSSMEFSAAGKIGTDGGLVWTHAENTFGIESQIIADDVLIASSTIGTGSEKTLTPEDGAATVRSPYYEQLISAENPAAGFSERGEVLVRPTNASYGAITCWTFAKHPRFFDVQRWTGDGGTSRQIEHSLDRAPGMIMVKRLDATGAWGVYHNHMAASPETAYMVLGTNAAAATSSTYWADTPPTSIAFSVGSEFNFSGGEYMAVIFADDDRSQGVIRTGTYTGTGAGGVPIQEIGWRPCWLLVKDTTATDSWRIYDKIRNGNTLWDDGVLVDDPTTNTVSTTFVTPKQNGWKTDSSSAGDEGLNANGNDYIWLAIRDNEQGLAGAFELGYNL